MYKVSEATPLPGYRLALKFADGTEGIVDLSDMAGQGVFSVWQQPGVYESVRVTSEGEVAWGDDIDLCPDALYMEVTGKKPEDLFADNTSLAAFMASS